VGFCGATEELLPGLSLERANLPKGALLQNRPAFALLRRSKRRTSLAKSPAREGFSELEWNRWLALAEGLRTRRQMAFDGLDQLLDVDWLGKKWMSVDVEASVRFGPCDQSSKENDRRVLQFRIASDLCRELASVSVGHYDIKEDQIRPKIPRGLMSPGGVVLFEDQITACLFEKNFDQMGRVLVVINN
jgi:hypothetical protein